MRLVGFAITLFWVIAMSWLVWHDIAPAWIAQDPPRVVARDWVERYGKKTEFGIYDQANHRIGGIWTEYSSAAATDRVDEIYLDRVPMIGPTMIDIKSEFDIDGRLDETEINVLGAWNPIRIKGERYPTQFAFEISAGAFRQAFKIDLTLAGKFSASFRPFDAMPDVSVGQSWRMQVFNPVAAVTGIGETFIHMVVMVTGRELKRVGGELRDCLIVETENAKAWVDRRSGVVIEQQITLPIGVYVIRTEPYSERNRREAAARFDQYRNAAQTGRM